MNLQKKGIHSLAIKTYKKEYERIQYKINKHKTTCFCDYIYIHILFLLFIIIITINKLNNNNKKKCIRKD